MEIDHIMPESLGGSTEEDNLWLACSFCNEYKGDRVAGLDPISGDIASLFNPRNQHWDQHFRWVNSAEHIEGITATGRATVITLRLNRPLLIRARRLWIAVGWHPPHDDDF